MEDPFEDVPRNRQLHGSTMGDSMTFQDCSDIEKASRRQPSESWKDFIRRRPSVFPNAAVHVHLENRSPCKSTDVDRQFLLEKMEAETLRAALEKLIVASPDFESPLYTHAELMGESIRRAKLQITGAQV